MADTSAGRSRVAANMISHTVKIGKQVAQALHPQGYPHPGRITTSGRGAPGAAKARVKRKAKNKAARKARKNK
jgi:hypothetical protein|uniref:Uncharacterized protein n=1 Tax=Myoviridae sp. ctshb19 TaxID=2825194 RepID=A0A8S5UGA1_9CAUD|nr:MAG TPA: hypothetical protein [Myoviridae sp. ctshb19]